MKKRFLSHFLLFVLSASLLTLALSSCTGFFKDDSGTASVSFTIDHSIFETNTARDASGSGEQYTLVLSLGGDYEDTQTLTWTRGSASTSTIEFDAVPAGCEIYAEAKLFRPRENGTLQQRYYGKSDIVTIATGDNPVSIKIDSVIDTPIVTYNRQVNTSNYQYYLDGTNFITASQNYCFDKDGYFYALLNNGEIRSIITNNPQIPVTSIDLSPGHGSVCITSDLAKNIMYMYVPDENALTIYKYPNFFNNGEIANPNNSAQHWTFTIDPGWPQYCVINNDTAYILSAYNDIHSVSLLTAGSSTDLSDETGTHIDYDADSISDIIALDNAVYLLWRKIDTYAGDGAIGSTGGLIKYDSVTGTIKTIGLSSEKIQNTDFTDIGMYVYGTSKTTSLVYKDRESGTENLSNPVFLSGNSLLETNENGVDVFMNTKFPTINTPAPLSNMLSTSAFYGAEKIIAIKPKKLVISDDGIAFYTDSNVLKYKNVNRIVTVDLENFAMSVSETNVRFYEDYTDLISRTFNIGGTNFGSRNNLSGSLWFINDVDSIEAQTVGTNAELRLGITSGE